MTLRIRRGPESQRTSIIPMSGELIFTTDAKELYVGDGSTPGGILASGVHGYNNLTAEGLFFELSLGSNEVEFRALAGPAIGMVPSGGGPNLAYNFTTKHWEIDGNQITTMSALTLVNISTAGANEGDVPTVVGGTLVYAAPAPGGGGGIVALSDADDLDLASRQDGYVIKWDDATQQYVHSPDLNDGSGTPSLEGLSDVANIGTATNLQVLSKNASSGKWEPRNQEPGPTMLRNLDAANLEIQRPVIRGNADISYDLSADPSNLINNGVASLSAVHNRYHYANLTSELEVRLPGISGNRLPYGTISVKLGAGGRLILGNQPHQYRWMRQLLTDPEPAIPSETGAAFQLSYFYDPVIGGYMVNLSRAVPIPAPGTAVQFVPGSVRRSSFPEVNQSSFTWQVPWRSTIQDGTVYKYVGWITDNSAGKTPVPPANLTHVVSTPPGQPGPYQWWGRYKPTQAELNSGTPLSVTGSLSNEFGQFVAFEVRYADPSSPDTAAVSDYSATARSTVGPLTLNNPQNGSLLISSFSRNDLNPMGQTVLDQGLWQELTDLSYDYPITFGVVPILVHAQAEAAAGNILTPRYQSNVATELGMVAFVIRT